MESYEIRLIKSNEIDKVVDIWYECSIISHKFIVDDYWEKNKESMKNKYIPASETYVISDKTNIFGFVSLVDNYLAAIFIREEMQGKGLGTLLLNYVKNIRDNIQLKVYKKNERSFQFYKTKGFLVIDEGIDEDTKEEEFVMQWKSDSSF